MLCLNDFMFILLVFSEDILSSLLHRDCTNDCVRVKQRLGYTQHDQPLYLCCNSYIIIMIMFVCYVANLWAAVEIFGFWDILF
jgi:hypothetical protein